MKHFGRIIRNVIPAQAGISLAFLFFAACSDIGERDNPLDPGAENYEAIEKTSSSTELEVSSSDKNEPADKSSSSVKEDSPKSSERETDVSSSSSSSVKSEINKGSSSAISSSGEESSSSEAAPLSSSENDSPKSSADEQSSSSTVVELPKSSADVQSSSSVAAWTCGDSTITRGDVEYKTVVINEKCWIKENLQYEPSSGNTMCYGESEANCAAYGRLYDYTAANLACPTGWRLPTKTEYEDLADYSGADMYDAGAHFKATSGWTGESGDDLLEFTALPGGKCDEEQSCSKMGTSGYWWTSTEKVKNASHYALYLNGDGSSFTAANIMDNDQYISVRCVKK